MPEILISVLMVLILKSAAWLTHDGHFLFNGLRNLNLRAQSEVATIKMPQQHAFRLRT